MTPASPEPARTGAPRRPLLWGLGALALAGAVVASIALATSSPPPAPPATTSGAAPPAALAAWLPADAVAVVGVDLSNARAAEAALGPTAAAVLRGLAGVDDDLAALRWIAVALRPEDGGLAAVVAVAASDDAAAMRLRVKLSGALPAVPEPLRGLLGRASVARSGAVLTLSVTPTPAEREAVVRWLAGR
ncbi:MAG: hypothetical protein H6745_29415 [Deltaproteobacteria bacterium]|nr:hypothetical protein [Deltaproteobacteria bacterium]